VTASDEHWAVDCDSYETASAGSERVLSPVNMPLFHGIIFTCNYIFG